jgi:hypothetical protein
MSEVVLSIDDAVGLEEVIKQLSPYIREANIKETTGCIRPKKIWDGRADWLDNPIKMDSFTPLKREEIYDRKSIP